MSKSVSLTCTSCQSGSSPGGRGGDSTLAAGGGTRAWGERGTLHTTSIYRKHYFIMNRKLYSTADCMAHCTLLHNAHCTANYIAHNPIMKSDNYIAHYTALSVKMNFTVPGTVWPGRPVGWPGWPVGKGRQRGREGLGSTRGWGRIPPPGKYIRSREQGAGCREQGEWRREQGAGSREQGARSREQGAGRSKKKKRNMVQRAGKGEKGAGSREQGAGNKE